MTQHLIYRVFSPSDAPLDAAHWFHENVIQDLRLPPDFDWSSAPFKREEMTITVVFPAANHTHRNWRLAAIQELAREYAPMRVNGVVGDDDAAIDDACAYLRDALGITGQLLAVDGKTAENG